MLQAQLMLGNECLGELEYEATTSAIVMADLFLSFLVEFLGKRFVMAKAAADPTSVSLLSVQAVTVLVLECGISSNGVRLVVAGDTFLTLFVVILFHQMFEGIALGTRIAQLGQHDPSKFGRASRRKRAGHLDTRQPGPLLLSGQDAPPRHPFRSRHSDRYGHRHRRSVEFQWQRP